MFLKDNSRLNEICNTLNNISGLFIPFLRGICLAPFLFVIGLLTFIFYLFLFVVEFVFGVLSFALDWIVNVIFIDFNLIKDAFDTSDDDDDEDDEE
jgi:hypothetical protein